MRSYYAVEYRTPLDAEGVPTVDIGTDGQPVDPQYRTVRRFANAKDRDRWAQVVGNIGPDVVLRRYAIPATDPLTREAR